MSKYLPIIFLIAVVVNPSFAILGLPDNANITNNENTNTITPVQAFSTYKDPKGRFTIDYPQEEWNVITATNRFQPYEVAFIYRNVSIDPSYRIENYSSISINVHKNLTSDIRDIILHNIIPYSIYRIPNFETVGRCRISEIFDGW